jgi:hypothetical protein
VALNALKNARTTNPLLLHCQSAFNNISSRNVLGLYWVPGHAGIGGNEITYDLRGKAWLKTSDVFRCGDTRRMSENVRGDIRLQDEDRLSP